MKFEIDLGIGILCKVFDGLWNETLECLEGSKIYEV
jgi:hypothetical protein